MKLCLNWNASVKSGTASKHKSQNHGVITGKISIRCSVTLRISVERFTLPTLLNRSTVLLERLSKNEKPSLVTMQREKWFT